MGRRGAGGVVTYDEILFLDTVRMQAVYIGRICIAKWRYSRSACQGARHYACVSGLWEWYFW